MSSDYSAGITIHRRDGAELTSKDELAIHAAVDAMRQGDPGFSPRFGEFEFRYGVSAAHGNFRNGIYIALSDYFIDDETNDAPAEVLLQRDIPAAEQLATELQERLADNFEVCTCFVD
jgi:hypothetical protein